MEDYIVDVCGDNSRAAFLIKGTKNVLYDTGMAYSAGQMIENIKRELDGAPLDAVLLSHSHYDHAAGIPFLKREWPGLLVYGSAYAAQVFQKPSAQAVIRRMSDNAAREAGFDRAPDYREEELQVDVTVKDGDMLEFGNHEILVYETPGHTRCSLSFLVDRDVLFASETVGVFMGDWYMPCYLVGYQMAVDSLEKLCHAPAKRLFISHQGIQADQDLQKRFLWLKEQMARTKDEIIEIIRTSKDEEEAMAQMFWKYHDGVVSEEEQPSEAFRLNAAATLKLIRRECMEG